MVWQRLLWQCNGIVEYSVVQSGNEASGKAKALHSTVKWGKGKVGRCEVLFGVAKAKYCRVQLRIAKAR